MNRTFLAAALALSLAACQQDPGGRCGADADCATGQHCSNGLCLSDLRQAAVGESCYVDKDCVGWADCLQGHCLLAPGACDTTADCQPWQGCNAGHACEMVPGGCANEADCAAWQDCDTSAWRCATAPGFCGSDAGCAAWQDCGLDHRCALTPGMCGNGTDCAGWQVCDGAHACATAPGFCATTADCPQVWEVCNASHTCENGPGYCGSSADCEAWQQCDAVHACVTAPGFCDDAADCQTWEQCDAGHQCALAPNRCVVAADCGPGQVCEGHDCVADPCASRPPICSGTTSGFSITGATGSLAPGTHEGTHFDSRFDGRLALGFPDPSTASNRQSSGVDVRDAGGAFWDFGFSAPLLTTGKYTIGPNQPAYMYAGPDGSDCWEPGGWFSLCEIEVAHEPWYGWSDPTTLTLTAVFHQTCGIGGTGPAVDGCVRFVLGGEPGQFGPPRQLEGRGYNVCANGNGLLRCWGMGPSAPSVVAPDVASAAGVGYYHACALFAGGEVRCWGRNYEGQSGNGADTSDVERPLTVIASGAVDVFAGYGASYALMGDGRVVYWGVDPTAPRSDVPVERFPAGAFVWLSAAYDFGCGITPAGGVQCWGSNAEGQLGIGRQYPVPGNPISQEPLDVVGLPGPVVRLDLAEKTVCAVIDSGALYCWGRNYEGQVGIGTTDSPVLTPTLVPGLESGVTDVAVGGNHACAVVDGGVMCWGWTNGGKVGNGTVAYTVESSPVEVIGMPPGSGAVQVAADWYGSCARLADETLWCWGADIAGDGVQNDEGVPVRVTRW